MAAGINLNNNKVVTACIVVGLVCVTSILLYKLTRPKKRRRLITIKDPSVKYALRLIEKEEISHDTRRFRFALPSRNHVLGVHTGRSVHVSAVIDGELVTRQYNPVSHQYDFGFVDLVIKIYFKNVHPKFPNGGKLSQHLESLKIGETVNFHKPSGLLVYNWLGNFYIQPSKEDDQQWIPACCVGMVAGGTGITPMLQIIRAVLEDPRDDTELFLLYANKTEQDILFRDELEKLRNDHPHQFHLHFTLDQADPSWTYSRGFINSDMLLKNMPIPNDDAEFLILLCGPPAMIKHALPNLKKLRYTNDQIFVFD